MERPGLKAKNGKGEGMAGRRIGLLGGTFNPVHLGHIRAALEVKRRFRLEKVLFIPSSIPPHKRPKAIASAEDRLRMVGLACRGRKGLSASPIEIKAGGTSYSILTLDKILRRFPGGEVFFILGLDAFLEIDAWRDCRRVLEQCHFIVISRPGYDLARARQVLRGSLASRMSELGQEDSAEEPLQAGPRIFLVPIAALDISSTDIRRRARCGEPLRGLVPPAVETYIRRHRLYQGGQ
jgi:nicotinate-nucleotide adenylyltransferase